MIIKYIKLTTFNCKSDVLSGQVMADSSLASNGQDFFLEFVLNPACDAKFPLLSLLYKIGPCVFPILEGMALMVCIHTRLNTVQ